MQRDIGRLRICEQIAKFTPYSIDTVYEVYEIVLEQNKKQNNVVMLDKQLQDVKTILQTAAVFQVPPVTLAYNIYKIIQKENS